MTEQVVKVSGASDGVVQIVMEDRESGNGFSEHLVNQLVEAFRRVSGDTECRAVILTGYDTYFASGGTQESLLALHGGAGKFTDSSLYRLPLECELPVVAAMQGHAIGGGLVLGLSCDCSVLAREGLYTANFMKYGFTPGMGATDVVPRKLGCALGQEMLLSARNYRGAELAERGVPLAIVPRAQVLDYAWKLGREIAEKPRIALVALKAHLTRQAREDLTRAVQHEVAMHDLTFGRAEVRERITALFGK
jgi:polyketide biosynthesis enoyl-CoA hydratase PksI